MRRVLLFALGVLLLVTSCSSTFYTVRALTATAPLNDNAAASCSVAEVLWPVSATAPRMMHLRWTQGGLTVREDSTATTAGTAVAFPAIFVPTSATVTATAWASDVGGAGCPFALSLTPVATTKPPAMPTLVVN